MKCKWERQTETQTGQRPREEITKKKKKEEAIQTPHIEEEKSKALCQGRILKKPTGKADGKYVWKQC